jgi:hypothetical protein
MDEWTSMAEKLPTGGKYLIYQDGKIEICIMTEEFCEHVSPNAFLSMCSHWMLLPKPPKE